MKRTSILTVSLAFVLNSVFAQTTDNPHAGKITVSNAPLNFPTQVIDTPEDLIGIGVNDNDEYISFNNIDPKTKNLLYKKLEYTVYHLPDMQKVFYKKYERGRYFYLLSGSRPNLLRFDSNNAVRLDLNTGKKIWSTRG